MNPVTFEVIHVDFLDYNSHAEKRNTNVPDFDP